MTTRCGALGGAIVAVLACRVLAPVSVDAQENVRSQAALDSLAAFYPTNEMAAEVPFGPGERARYRVEVGIFDVGEGHMSIEALDTVRGNETFRAVMEIDASILGFKVHNTDTTFFDTSTLQSWRYIKLMNNTGYHGTRHYEMYPAEDLWVNEDKEEESPDRDGPLGSSFPLDDISFIYFMRQMTLEVGRTYTVPRYFKEDGNPVVIKVLRREVKKVDGGEFNTIVIQPLVQTDGLFGDGGEAEIYLTDDDRKIMIYMKSNIPKFPGALELYLKSYEPGVPLNPDARQRAASGRAERAQADTIQGR